MHCFAPLVQAFVQHAAAPGAPVHAPPEHGDDDDSYRHPCPSIMQPASVSLLAQTFPKPLQTGSTWQEHFAEPTVPVQA